MECECVRLHGRGHQGMNREVLHMACPAIVHKGSYHVSWAVAALPLLQDHCTCSVFLHLLSIDPCPSLYLWCVCCGRYRVSAFYLSSALSDLPMDCALPCLFVIIIYFMGGLRLTAGAFFANLFGLVLNVLVAQSLGLLLGVAFMNPKTAQVSNGAGSSSGLLPQSQTQSTRAVVILQTEYQACMHEML